jgi:hypothetical protein
LKAAITCEQRGQLLLIDMNRPLYRALTLSWCPDRRLVYTE